MNLGGILKAACEDGAVVALNLAQHEGDAKLVRFAERLVRLEQEEKRKLPANPAKSEPSNRGSGMEGIGFMRSRVSVDLFR